MPGERSVEIKDGERITAVYDIINHLGIYSISHAVPVWIQETAFSQREYAILTASGRLLYLNWHLSEQWCGDHYQGVKHCYRCLTGIYSIEEANWQRNYCCSTR